MPAGLTFDRNQNQIQGTLELTAEAKDYTISVKARDAAGNLSVVKTFVITVQTQADKYTPTPTKQTVEVNSAADTVLARASI